MQKKDMDVQRAEWREELKAIRAEEEKQTDKHIVYYALASLLLAICAIKWGHMLGVCGFLANVQVYRYFKRNHCMVEKLGLDMKVFAFVAGVSYIFTIFMSIFIEYAVIIEHSATSIMQIIYGIATLCVVLNTVYICVYLYGVRK